MGALSTLGATPTSAGPLSVRAYVHSHNVRIQDLEDPERIKRETERQKKLNLEGTFPSQ